MLTLFKTPIARLVLGAIFISFAPILVKAVDSVGPAWIGVYRCGIAAMLLLPAVLIHSRKSKIRLVELGSDRFWRYVVLAGFCFACDLFLWHRALHYVGAGLGTLLANTQVFYLALFGILFAGEKGSKRLYLAILLGFVGLVLALGEEPRWAKDGLYLRGIVYGLLTGISYTGYIIFIKLAELRCNELKSIHKLALVSFFSALFLTIFSLASEPLTLPEPMDLLWLILLALLPQFIGWLLIMNNLPHVPISKAGLILLTQPCLALIMGAAIYKEHLNTMQTAGVMVALTGIYIGSVRSARTNSD